MTKVTLARAKNHLDELIARAAAGERILIQQRERAVAALISAAELEQLEKISRSARRSVRALGQHPELLKQIKAGKLHPAMAAFGLWRDESDLADLSEQIYTNRNHQGTRAGVAW